MEIGSDSTRQYIPLKTGRFSQYLEYLDIPCHNMTVLQEWKVEITSTRKWLGRSKLEAGTCKIMGI